MKPSTILLHVFLPMLSSAASSATLTLTSPPTTTVSSSTMANRITYDHLPSCVSLCVRAAVGTVPATPFVAESFCGLPTGRYAYIMPQECVETACGKEDKKAEESWRKSVCKGVKTVEKGGEELKKRQEATSTSSSSGVTGAATSTGSTASSASSGSSGTSSSVAPTVTPLKSGVCAKGHKACPAGLYGGCCPEGYTCNMFDCQPPSSKISDSSSATAIDVTTFFPACAHNCLSTYLPLTQCSLAPLNSTCFCRLHDFIGCLGPDNCPPSTASNFAKKHAELCKDLWFFTPYSKKSDRWCDLDGTAYPAGMDVRDITDALNRRCANWWKARNGGKRFGIVLGIMLASIIFLWLCCGCWIHVARSGDARIRRKEKEKTMDPWNSKS